MKLKKDLRKEILALRDTLTLEARIEKSRIITEKVIRHEKFQEADKVLLFASFRSEVDTTEIFKVAIAMGKEVYFPRVEGKEMEFYRIEKETDLIEGYRGIREPKGEASTRFAVNPKAGDAPKILVIMPGAVFDADGNRIGYGGGYYDKFLLRLETTIEQKNLYKIALAFECQMVEKNIIIKELHDKNPDIVITEKYENI